MNYVEFEAGGKEYKLKLDIRATVALEKRLGCNPLAIFGDGEKIPTITQMVAILHAAAQPLNHSVSFDDAMTIFDKWLEEGHTMTDFLTIILDIYKVSGIIQKDTEKNA